MALRSLTIRQLPELDTVKKVSILLVDDRIDGLLTLEVVLESDDYELVKARSGEEALKLLLDDREFAVILLDVQMPNMDGFETASLIKTHERLRHIPIIFVTGIHGDPRFVSQGYEVGAIDYVCKPFEPYILKSKVSVLVDLYRKTKLLEEIQRKEHEKKLSETKEEFLNREKRLVSLVENSTEFTAILGANQNLIYLNKAGRKLIGLSLDEEIHSVSLRDFLLDGQNVSSIEKMYLGQLQEWESEMIFRHFETGTPIPVLSRGYPIEYSELSDLNCFALISQDIREKKATEITLKASEQRFRKLSEELIKANSELQQFAWIASHDLKEPLRVVSSYVKLLQRSLKEQINKEIEGYVNYILEGTSRMKSLLDGLLSYSGVGNQHNANSPINCNKILSVVLSNLEILINENEATITHEELPTLIADGVQLGQLFQNLIANGIKFRREVKPCIHISSQLCEKEWKFEVKDNGIGIESKYLDKVFGVFQRLHSSEKYSGAGIGLAICKKIVDKHGGRIWASSTPGTGSSFYFTIPNPQENSI